MPVPQILSHFDFHSDNPQNNWVVCQQIKLNKTKPHALFVSLQLQSQNAEKNLNQVGQEIISFITATYKHLKNQPTLSWLQTILTHLRETYSDEYQLASTLTCFTISQNATIIISCGTKNETIKLYRSGQIISFPLTPKGFSGKTQGKDLWLFANPIFFKKVPPHTQTLIFQDPEMGLDRLKHLDIHFLSAASSLLLGEKKHIKTKTIQNTSINPDPVPSHNHAKNIFPPSPKSKPRLSHQTNPRSILKKRRISLLLAFIFIAILSISLWFGHRKRTIIAEEKQRDQLISDVNYRLQQAESLKKLNPARAKTMLGEAQDLIQQYQSDEADIDINSLKTQINHSYAAVSKQYLIDNPSIFYDLSLIKEGFTASQSYLSDSKLTLLDEQTQTIIQLDIQTKSSEIIAGSDLVSSNSILATNPDWIFLVTGSKLAIIDSETKQQLKSFTLSKINVDQLLGYSGNAYILDKNLGQLWRFRGTSVGLNKPDKFFSKQHDLSYVKFVSIDGAVWFLRNDNGIEKFTSGIKDAYYPSLPLDQPLNNPTQFFTSDTSTNLYITDPNNHRVVVVSKQNQYVGQYVWDKINEAAQAYPSEPLGKLLIIKGDKIYGIDLKN